MTSFFYSPTLLTVLLGAFFASIAVGVIGTFLVTKRIVFMSGGISHTVLGGMGIAFYINRVWNIPQLLPIHGAFVFALIAAIIISVVHSHIKEREDTIIAALWAFGMALGIIFVASTPGYTVELLSFLFGNLLWISHEEIMGLAALDVFLIAGFIVFKKHIELFIFDEDQASILRMPTKFMQLGMLILTSITIVALLNMIGAILVVALLTLPAAIAGLFARSYTSMTIGAIAIAAFTSVFGIIVAYYFNKPPGATITLVASCIYFLALATRKRLI